MFIRFVLLCRNDESNVKDGIFSASYELSESAELSKSNLAELRDLLDWFESDLATPVRFNRSRSKGFYRRDTKGISWFRDSSPSHISVARRLAALLNRNGRFVEELTTKRPGYIVYEDDHQVVAEPFRDT